MRPERPIFFEPFRLDPVNACLWRGPQALHLTPKVFAVLSYLLRYAGRLVTKDELLRAVWPDSVVSEASLTVCIREIRKVLGDRPTAPQFIETRHRRGYRFIAKTTEVDGPPTAEPSPQGGEGRRESSPLAPGGRGGGEEGAFVGRADELLQLHGWLEKALRGERQVVFVTGEPGIGKSALVEAFCQRLGGGPDLGIARGQCFEHYGAGEAYLPVLEALNRLCHQPAGERLVALLRRRAPTWLAQLPWLPGAAREVSPHETLGATPARMLREIAEAVEAWTTETALVLVLEDLHWSDYATLDLVSALARRREPARLLLLATYRPVEVIVTDHPLHALKQDLQTHRHCAELALELLAEAAVAEYLALRFPGSPLPTELARLVHERTGGNPLFMVHVSEDLVAKGVLVQQAGGWQLRGEPGGSAVGVPESLRLTIEQQLARLGPAEQRLLEGAGVAGMEFSAAAVAAALGEEVEPVEEGCARLARRQQFLRAAGVSEWPDGTVAGRYRFLHWLYQDVLYQRVPAARRRSLHRRLGERAEAAHGEAAGELAAELARHFEQGGDHRRAIRYLRQAAHKACRRSAQREALHHLQRALDLGERLPEGERADSRRAVLEQRGQLRRSTGDMPGAADDFTALVACAGERGDVEVKALLDLASVLFWFDRARCLAVADRAVERSQYIQDPLLRAQARAQCGHWRLQLRGWQPEERQAFTRAVELLRQAGDRELLGQYLALDAYHRCQQSEYRAACDAAEEGMQLTLAAGDAYFHISSQYFQAWALLHRGEWGVALRRVREGLQMAQKNGHGVATRLFQLLFSWLHEQALAFERARELAEPATRQAQEGQCEQFMGRIRLGMAHLGLGECAAAFRCFREMTAQLERGVLIDWFWQMQLHRGLGEYWLAQGAWAEARREAERACAMAALSGERTYLALGRRTLAAIAVAERNWDQAEAELARALAVLEGDDVPLAEWRVYATAAHLHQQRRRKAAAARCRARSRAVLHRLADSLGDEADLRQHLLSHLPV
jgi:DNA-binding winged helix-turn-helix (wHTH) protein/tetratricopeptide (TPR) repeat protein